MTELELSDLPDDRAHAPNCYTMLSISFLSLSPFPMFTKGIFLEGLGLIHRALGKITFIFLRFVFILINT